MTDWQQLTLDALIYATHKRECGYNSFKCVCGFKAMKERIEAAYWASERGKQDLVKLYQPKEEK